MSGRLNGASCIRKYSEMRARRDLGVLYLRKKEFLNLIMSLLNTKYFSLLHR